MNTKKVSLKDIAVRAGVSTALVSYVLNGREKETRVGREIAKKIKEIAIELDYQPNHLAKSLRSGKSYTIGLIIADISNPFFANISRIVEDEAKKNGYTVIIGSSDEKAEKAYDFLNVLINRQVDGFIIVVSEHSEPLIHFLKDRNIPFVLLDRHIPALQTDFVATNNYKASYDAAVHLIQGGYERIGIIAYKSEMYHMQERIRGYRQAIADHQLLFSGKWEKLVRFEFIEQEVRTAIDELISTENSVDAIIFTTYGLAINGLKYLDELKLRIPADLGIVSFGQSEVFDLYYCPITYLKQPLELLGRTSVELLVTKLKNPAEAVKQILMEAQLMVRESSKVKVRMTED